MTNEKVAVLGAGGLTGQFLVGALGERGLVPRAVLRREIYAERLPEGTETAVADLDDVGALATAIHGCSAVYLIPPSFNEAETRFAANVMEAMAKAQVRRLVYHSVLHPGTPDMPHHWRKLQVELLIRESDIEWTILQPAMYVQTVLSFLSADQHSLNPPFDPDQPFNILTPGDLADAVASVVASSDAAYSTLEIAGTERRTLRELAAGLARALGHPIEVSLADMEETVRSRAARRGWSEAQQIEYRAMLEYYNRFGLPGNGLTLEMLLGRKSTPFAEAAKALLAALPAISQAPPGPQN